VALAPNTLEFGPRAQTVTRTLAKVSANHRFASLHKGFHPDFQLMRLARLGCGASE
jgi:hypothetical protein